MFSLPGGTSSGCSGMETSATLYPCGNRLSNDVKGSSCVRVGCGISSCSCIRSGGVLSSRIAGGYRFSSLLTEGVKDPLFNNADCGTARCVIL